MKKKIFGVLSLLATTGLVIGWFTSGIKETPLFLQILLSILVTVMCVLNGVHTYKSLRN